MTAEFRRVCVGADLGFAAHSTRPRPPSHRPGPLRPLPLLRAGRGGLSPVGRHDRLVLTAHSTCLPSPPPSCVVWAVPGVQLSAFPLPPAVVSHSPSRAHSPPSSPAGIIVWRGPSPIHPPLVHPPARESIAGLDWLSHDRLSPLGRFDPTYDLLLPDHHHTFTCSSSAHQVLRATRFSAGLHSFVTFTLPSLQDLLI
nr:hypothetical protein CFP56_21616 [Quercus suber]